MSLRWVGQILTVHVVYDHMSYSVLYKNEARSESALKICLKTMQIIHPKSTYINHILKRRKKHRYTIHPIPRWLVHSSLSKELLTDSVTGRGRSVARAALNHKDKTKGNKHTNAAPEVNLLLGRRFFVRSAGTRILQNVDESAPCITPTLVLLRKTKWTYYVI